MEIDVGDLIYYIIISKIFPRKEIDEKNCFDDVDFVERGRDAFPAKPAKGEVKIRTNHRGPGTLSERSICYFPGQ
jgi:hypothetical protein